MLRNIKKIFLLLLLFRSLHISYAQEGIVLRPIIENYASFPNYDMQYQEYHFRQPPNNPYFNFSKFPIILPDFHRINMGIQLEKKISKKINVCFGIQQDESTTGYMISTIEKTQNINSLDYTDVFNSNVTGLLTTKYLFYVIFKDITKNRRRIDIINYYFKSKKLKFGLDYIFGVNYINTYGTSDRPLIPVSADNIILFDNSVLDYKGGLYDANKKWNIKFTAGVRLNLIKRQKDILTFSLYFDQGIRNLSYQIFDATINKTINYHYIVSSKGTGIYFQISKPFYLNF